MSDKPSVQSAYLPRRDQVMPAYNYPSGAGTNGTLTVRSTGYGKEVRSSVLVNGDLKY